MSRIGKKPIEFASGVKITQANNKLTLNGPKGKIELKLHPKVQVEVDEAGKKIKVSCAVTVAQDKAVYGSFRSLINNAVIGVTQGYEKKLEIHGTGYNTKVQGKEIIINIGYSHPVKINIPEGITVTAPNPNQLILQGTDKELIGQFSTSIRAIKPCDPYNVKGIKFTDEVVRRKAGKTFVSGAT